MAVALLWTGCEGRDDIDPKQGNPFMLSICLPVEESFAPAGGGPLRVMGDPGTTERFELPRYVYIIIMKKAAGDPDWTLWQALSLTPVEGDWTKKRYGGVLPTVGDSIYEYNHEIDLLLSSNKFDGRVYVIASAVELIFNGDKEFEDLTFSNMDDVLGLTFNSRASGIQENLQHIYSTPYNYKPDGENYYGSFDKAQRVPHVSLLLYHVAAKVDINWFVAENKRIDRETPANAVRLTSMKACNLFNGDAYCFKPMENKQATKLNPSAGTGDTITMVTPSDMGLWWEGRSYFYTIPYTTTEKTGYYPLQMQMETNESGAIYKPTVYLGVNTSSPFVPWLRATFNINNPLAAGTAEKTVSL